MDTTVSHENLDGIGSYSPGRVAGRRSSNVQVGENLQFRQHNTRLYIPSNIQQAYSTLLAKAWHEACSKTHQIVNGHWLYTVKVRAAEPDTKVRAMAAAVKAFMMTK